MKGKILRLNFLENLRVSAKHDPPLLLIRKFNSYGSIGCIIYRTLYFLKHNHNFFLMKFKLFLYNGCQILFNFFVQNQKSHLTVCLVKQKFFMYTYFSFFRSFKVFILFLSFILKEICSFPMKNILQPFPIFYFTR